MRKVAVLLLIIVALTSSNKMVYGQDTREALVYMNEIFAPVDETKTETWQYLKAVTRGKGARKVESKRQNLILELKKAKSETQRKGKFHTDDSLRIAVVDYLQLSYVVLKEDFDKILDMEDIAEQSYDLMEAYILAKEKANEKLDSSFNEVVSAQQQFADRYGIELREAEKDKTSEKINKASEALSYYNDVYLIFFKVYKQEAYVLDAMQRNDLNAFEQNASTLEVYAQEGLTKLKEMPNYRGDGKLRVGAQKALMFYKKEAETDFPIMTDFYIKKDNFEKTQKLFESKSKKSRTQEDVDQYNKAINEFNTAVSKANQVSESSNKERGNMFNEWNKSIDNFFDTHSN